MRGYIPDLKHANLMLPGKPNLNLGGFITAYGTACHWHVSTAACHLSAVSATLLLIPTVMCSVTCEESQSCKEGCC